MLSEDGRSRGKVGVCVLTIAAVRAARAGEGRCGNTWSPPRSRSVHFSGSYPLVFHSCSPWSPWPGRGSPSAGSPNP